MVTLIFHAHSILAKGKKAEPLSYWIGRPNQAALADIAAWFAK
jgi:hypothetical protein